MSRVYQIIGYKELLSSKMTYSVKNLMFNLY